MVEEVLLLFGGRKEDDEARGEEKEGKKLKS